MNFESSPEQIGFMGLALEQARLAGVAGEVPVGAVVVRDGKVVAVGRNAPIAQHDPTAHAEIAALREAARVLGNYRLDGCDLYVTLEPCTMCSGAILQARLDRVFFGATDPKTGMAGSVMDLFSQAGINHQTRVQGGILAQQCSDMLQTFFSAKRAHQRRQKQALHPLRDDALRTPDAVFEGLIEYPWKPHYLSDLPALNGLRLHYIDEGPANAPRTYLCLHGNPTWSYLFRHMIPIFLEAGHRVVAPDWIGFGRSDKPKRPQANALVYHRQVVLELIERLDLCGVVVVGHEWGGQVGITLPPVTPSRFKGLLTLNTGWPVDAEALSAQESDRLPTSARHPDVDIVAQLAGESPMCSASELAAYGLVFPHLSFRSGLKSAGQTSAPVHLPHDFETQSANSQFWRSDWLGQSMVVYSDPHPTMAGDHARGLSALMRGCGPAIRMGSGRILPAEVDRAIAKMAADFFVLRNVAG